MSKLNVALIGQGFMGRTHSNAWGQVNRFFKPPLQAVMHTVFGQAEENPQAFADNWGWQTVDDQLGAARLLAGNRPGRRGHAQLHARPARQGGHRRRQALLLREADRRLAGRRPRDGRGRAEGQRQDLRLVQLPPRPGRGPGLSPGEGRPAGRDPPRAGDAICRTGPASPCRCCGVSTRTWPAPAPTAI